MRPLSAQQKGQFRGLTLWSAVAGTALALYGSIVVVELTERADIGQTYLSTGVPAVAGEVVLNVGVGKGAPGLGEVEVGYTTSTRQRIRTELVWIDVDTHIERNEERQTPDPGSRYAPPLKILHKPHSPNDAIALTDAERLVANRIQYRGLASAGIGLGLILLVAAAIRLAWQKHRRS